MPRRLQLDNGKPFQLGSASLGEIVRVSLHQWATPVFIPQGEPWRNGTCEQFNDTFDKRFFGSERFEDRDRLSHRALEFECFHNANHRYRATGKRTPQNRARRCSHTAPRGDAARPCHRRVGSDPRISPRSGALSLNPPILTAFPHRMPSRSGIGLDHRVHPCDVRPIPT
ncbi:MAG: hypothetical protein ACR2GL_06995 [Thermoleophilaceae bacterium]